MLSSELKDISEESINTPVVVLVGRPNVGKSTLFNRLTRTQNALVADYPGLTRDRQYGEAIYEDKPFIVVDTGGIGVDDAAVDELMSKQSEVALNEATHILFLVDAQAGLTGIDESIAARLRKINKPVYLIVNKMDGIDERYVSVDFHKLGLPFVFCISASHGRGIHNLLNELTANFLIEVADDLTATKATKIAFVGRPNVGKSTLINRMLKEDRVVVYDLPGTTRDSISIPFTRDEKEYILIDTAGVRRRSRVDEKIEKFSIIKTLQSIKAANVCILLLDAHEGLTDQDLHILRFVTEAGKALVVAVNKWDGLDAEHKGHVRDELSRRLQFLHYAKIRHISALHGSGVGVLWEDIEQAYASSIQALSTPQLTRILQDLVTAHTPPLVHGRHIKMRYAHAGGHNPPIIVIHGNQLESLPDSYKRYLMKSFTEKLGLVGTPLKLEFKGNVNPFKDKRNTLTPRQTRTKQRLMRYVKKRG